MLRSFESNQWIVEPIRLPVGLGLLPGATVARQSEYKFVMTPVLICLVGVCLRASVGRRPHSGRSHQRQADGVVVWLIGAVLAIGENGRAEAACFVG